VEHLSLTYIAQQSETKFVAMFVINLVTPKVAAKHKLLFNKLGSEVDLLNISVWLK
jgi:hypothetical protein